jgi:hypothetical protein
MPRGGMKKERRKLQLSKETLRGLTDGTLLSIRGGISGMNIPDSCGATNGWDCMSNAAQTACNDTDYSLCNC